MQAVLVGYVLELAELPEQMTTCSQFLLDASASPQVVVSYVADAYLQSVSNHRLPLSWALLALHGTYHAHVEFASTAMEIALADVQKAFSAQQSRVLWRCLNSRTFGTGEVGQALQHGGLAVAAIVTMHAWVLPATCAKYEVLIGTAGHTFCECVSDDSLHIMSCYLL